MRGGGQAAVSDGARARRRAAAVRELGGSPIATSQAMRQASSRASWNTLKRPATARTADATTPIGDVFATVCSPCFPKSCVISPASPEPEGAGKSAYESLVEARSP